MPDSTPANPPVIAYTDGSSLGNPGPGGYGVVLLSNAFKLRKELSEGFRKTTNNRMELLAVIVALEALKVPGLSITVYSDSQYVINSVEKGWVFGWVKKNFKGKKNADLWKRYLPLHARHKVRFQWVKGHAGIPENERCDILAKEAAQSADLGVDKGFESGLYS